MSVPAIFVKMADYFASGSGNGKYHEASLRIRNMSYFNPQSLLCILTRPAKAGKMERNCNGFYSAEQ
jgi:hypothetical protein